MSPCIGKHKDSCSFVDFHRGLGCLFVSGLDVGMSDQLVDVLKK